MIDPRIIIAGVIVSVSFAGGWIVHGWKFDADNAALQRDISAAKDANESLKTRLGVEREKHKKSIDAAAAGLRDVRVRLPESCKRTDSTTGGTIPATGTDELPNSAQAALDRFKRGVDEIVTSAEVDLSACRVVMEWAKSQGK